MRTIRSARGKKGAREVAARGHATEMGLFSFPVLGILWFTSVTVDLPPTGDATPALLDTVAGCEAGPHCVCGRTWAATIGADAMALVPPARCERFTPYCAPTILDNQRPGDAAFRFCKNVTHSGTLKWKDDQFYPMNWYVGLPAAALPACGTHACGFHVSVRQFDLDGVGRQCVRAAQKFHPLDDALHPHLRTTSEHPHDRSPR